MIGFSMLLLMSAAASAVRPVAVPNSSQILTPALQDARDQVQPDVAFDGKDTFLVVWQQGTNHVGRPGANILAMRLDQSGKPLDPQPLRICTAKGSQERPRVTFAGDRFYIVWQDYRNGKDWDIYFSRVSPSGKVIDPGGRPLATGPRNQAMPILAPARDGALSLWLHYAHDGFYQIHAAFLEPTGPPKHRQTLTSPRVSAARWYGYTPGWGYGRSRLAPKARPDVLRGGNMALIATSPGWLLSWNDESNWAPGRGGSLSRRFARLVAAGPTIHTTAITRTPVFLSSRATGRFASDGKNALYVDVLHQGRGLGRQIGVTLVIDRDTGQALPNPNSDPRRGVGSGWDPSRASLPFGQKIQLSPPLSVIYRSGYYLVVAAGRAALGGIGAHRLYAVRLDHRGKRLNSAYGNATTIYEGAHPPADPVLSASDSSVLLVFEQEDNDGVRRIHVMTIKDP